MTSGLEAAGDMVTGAAVARAVEPAHGEGTTHGEHACLNCGAALAGAFCHRCGQAAHVHRSLGGLGHEILHGVFHFEGKVWRTLPLLVARPGVLTRRYVQGQRASFVSPLALFLFCVFLMFAAFQLFGVPIGSLMSVSRDGVNLTPAQVSAELARSRAELAALQAQRARTAASGGSTAALDEKLEEQREEVAALQTADSMVHAPDLASRKPGDAPKTGVASLDERLRRAFDNPKLLVYKLQSSAYKYAWALIPLSLPFMWAMFPRRRDLKLYDHAVFVTYSISAVMLLLCVMAALSAAGVSSQWPLLLVPLHFFLQLKEGYALGIFAALWRTVALVVVACFTVALFGVVLLAQTL
jgi:hypothetical protein